MSPTPETSAINWPALLINLLFAGGMIGFCVWQVWKVVRLHLQCSRRMRRMEALQAIICSASSTQEERHAAFHAMMDLAKEFR